METNYQPLGFTFIALTKHYLNILDEQLKELPIEKYYYPFWYIAQNSGNINQQQMAECLDVDKVAIVRVVDYLEKIGFVERKINPEDRRCHALHATPFGLTHLNAIEKALHQTDQIFINQMKSNCDNWPLELIELNQKLKGSSIDKFTFDYKRIPHEND
jgi:MarR family transcriptional regulator, transcriptional regulator for hemolysin